MARPGPFRAGSTVRRIGVIVLQRLVVCLVFLSGIAHADLPGGERIGTLAAQVQTLADVREIASELAAMPFVPKPDVPDRLKQLSYEQFISIGYRHRNAVWDRTDSRFRVETFHQGFVQREDVTLYVREDGRNRLVPFDRDDFDYGGLRIDPDDIVGAGHAGVKVIGRFPGDDSFSEVITFLGGCYFRARSADTIYGTSARGVAVNQALPVDEEFPFFRAFWITRPAGGADHMSALALVDSPSLVGAYRFTIRPGESVTEVDIESSLHFRADVQKIGVAPLTSMWIWGDGIRRPSLDARPHVHDSDLLVVETDDGSVTARPLARIAYPSVSSIDAGSLVGFALTQRNRDFDQYNDTGANYHHRPTVAVYPNDTWRGGRVELFEIPGAHEGIDNIGAWWIPPDLPKAGDVLDLSYVVTFGSEDYAPVTRPPRSRLTDFDVRRHADADGDLITLTGVYTGETPGGAMDADLVTIRGELVDKTFETTDDGFTMSLTLRPTEDAPMQIEATPRVGDDRVGERLVYLCPRRHPAFVFPAVYTQTE